MATAPEATKSLARAMTQRRERLSTIEHESDDDVLRPQENFQSKVVIKKPLVEKPRAPIEGENAQAPSTSTEKAPLRKADMIRNLKKKSRFKSHHRLRDMTSVQESSTETSSNLQYSYSSGRTQSLSLDTSSSLKESQEGQEDNGGEEIVPSPSRSDKDAETHFDEEALTILDVTPSIKDSKDPQDSTKDSIPDGRARDVKDSSIQETVDQSGFDKEDDFSRLADSLFEPSDESSLFPKNTACTLTPQDLKATASWTVFEDEFSAEDTIFHSLPEITDERPQKMTSSGIENQDIDDSLLQSQSNESEDSLFDIDSKIDNNKNTKPPLRPQGKDKAGNHHSATTKKAYDSLGAITVHDVTPRASGSSLIVPIIQAASTAEKVLQELMETERTQTVTTSVPPDVQIRMATEEVTERAVDSSNPREKFLHVWLNIGQLRGLKIDNNDFASKFTSESCAIVEIVTESSTVKQSLISHKNSASEMGDQIFARYLWHSGEGDIAESSIYLKVPSSDISKNGIVDIDIGLSLDYNSKRIDAGKCCIQIDTNEADHSTPLSKQVTKFGRIWGVRGKKFIKVGRKRVNIEELYLDCVLRTVYSENEAESTPEFPISKSFETLISVSDSPRESSDVQRKAIEINPGSGVYEESIETAFASESNDREGLECRSRETIIFEPQIENDNIEVILDSAVSPGGENDHERKDQDMAKKILVYAKKLHVEPDQLIS